MRANSQPNDGLHRLARACLAAAACLATSACTSDAGHPQSGGTSTPGGEDSSVEVGVEHSEARLELLKVVLGFGVANVIDSLARERESVVSDCMRLAGFDYQPATYEAGYDYFSPTPSRAPSFLAEYGYGVATLVRERDVADALHSIANSEPNARYVDGLTESLRSAYYLAMYGPPDPNAEGGYVPLDTTKGCNGKGVAAGEESIGLRGNVSQTPEYQSAVAEIQQTWRADPRWSTALADWSSCMAGRGFEIASPDAASALVSDWLGPIAPVGSAEVEAVDAFGGRHTVQVAEYGEHLQKVAEQEVALGLADVECSAESELETVRAMVMMDAAGEFMETWFLL